MKKLAMRATKKDWDSIKDRIELPLWSLSKDFKKYPFLINYDNRHFRISNLQKGGFKSEFDDLDEIHETFNAKIFLEACGIEFDEYKITKETVIKYQMKDEFPEVVNEQEAFFNKPLLSLNDLLSVWGFQSEIELYKTAPLFKNFENLAKSK